MLSQARHWFPWLAVGSAALHLVYIATVFGFAVEFVIVDVALVVLALYPGRPKEFAMGMFPLWASAVAYSLVTSLLPFRGRVHIADLHAWEIALFGVTLADGNTVTPAAAWQLHTHWLLDAICGAAYIVYFIVPAGALLVWIWQRRTRRVYRMGIAFFILNVASFTTQILWPAAPPWYVDQYGLGPVVIDAAPSAAGCLRFDALIGIPYFEAFYAKSLNVFGSVPSLHVANVTLAAIAATGLRRAWTVSLWAVALLMSVSAVYLNHHYILDILCGFAFAAAAYGLVLLGERRFLSATPTTDDGSP